MTERFTYRAEIKSNWKLYMDAFQEFYHAPVLHQKQTPPDWSGPALKNGFEAPHYQIDGPHRLVSTAGIRLYELPENMRKPIEGLTRSGNFGPWDAPDLGEMPPGLNPANCDPWGLDSLQMFPNFVILIWSLGWYLTYHYWPTSYNSHVFESTLYFVPPKTARERLALEMAATTFKEYGLQDANTLEATQSMLESRVISTFPSAIKRCFAATCTKSPGNGWTTTERNGGDGLMGARSYRQSSRTSSPLPPDGAWPPRRSVTGTTGKFDGRHAGVLRRHHGAWRRGDRLLRQSSLRRDAREVVNLMSLFIPSS